MRQRSDGVAKLLLCLALAAGFACQSAAQQPAISRAVEVPPPKGWTPDAPLFTDEVVAPAAPSPVAPSRSVPPKVAKAPALPQPSESGKQRSRVAVAKADVSPTARGKPRKPALVKAAGSNAGRVTKPAIRVKTSNEAERQAKAASRARVASSSRRGDVPDRRVPVASRKAVGEAKAGRVEAKKKGDARRRALRGSQG